MGGIPFACPKFHRERGWGDRRVCIQDSRDFKTWSGPQPLLQPDPQDGLVEFYGMPVFRYGEAYIGLLWIFHCQTSEPPTGFNRFVGSLDTHLTYSYDGRHFQRGFTRGRQKSSSSDCLANPAVTYLWRPFVLDPYDEVPVENPKKA